MKKSPLVSIVVTCYNYENYISEAINSVFAQNYKNIELIVINDGSTDNSDSIIRSLKRKNNFRYISRENKGIVATRNQALRLFKGDYLVQLDADDTIPENYISELVKTAQEHEADLVYTDYINFGAFEEVTNFPEYNYEMLKNGNYIHISCLLSRRAVENRTFDENLSKMSHEDWDFFLGICAAGFIAVKCNTVKLNYRMHTSSRNNHLSVLDDRIKYTNVYKYIIDKQEKTKPEDFYFLVGRLFAQWYGELDEHRSSQDAKVISLENQLNRILSSRRYQVAEKIGNRISKVRNIATRTKRVAKRRLKRAFSIPKDLRVESIYTQELKKIKNSGKKKAIILHLYYLDMWPYFVDKLKYIMGTNEYDLIVNIPHYKNKEASSAQKNILADFSDAVVLLTPNQGRDVLSFLKIGKALRDNGYDYILKLHSKKSPQRQDGKDWSDEIITSLVAKDEEKLKQIEKAFTDTNAAIIGPSGSYVPLTTYYNDNQPKVHWLLSELFNKEVADEVNAHNDQYGFFAGTMFWVRLSAISGVFDLPLTANNFPAESAQLDGTVAHALERVLCVIPEYSKMDIYEVNNKRVKKIPYKTEYIPDWSDYYHVKENRQ